MQQALQEKPKKKRAAKPKAEKPAKKAKAEKPAAKAKAEKPAKKEKKKKDPNAPKRAMSAFMFFSNDKRATVSLSSMPAPLPLLHNCSKPPKKGKVMMCHATFISLWDLSLQAKKDHPDASFGEVGKILGSLWKEADAKEKSKFEDMAKKDKERYEKEKKEYKADE